MHIRVGDTVEILTGDDRISGDPPKEGEARKPGQLKRTRAKVLGIDRDAGKLLVEGVNLVYKHMRRSQRNPQGGRLSKEMPVPVSNVQLVCPSCNKAARTGSRLRADGSKERYCKKCGSGIGTLAPPRKPATAGKTK